MTAHSPPPAAMCPPVTRLRLGAAALLALLLAGCGDPATSDAGPLRDAARTEGPPMCPWRDPAADTAGWFPGATRTHSEILILSALRLDLTQALGRAPSAEENALYLHQVLRDAELLGEVAVRRVKGESGAVEIAVAFAPDGRVHGVRVQRSREPEAVTAALDARWLDAFRGRGAGDPLVPGRDLPAVPEAARITAGAIADGVRSLLILRSMATRPQALRRPAPESSVGHLH